MERNGKADKQIKRATEQEGVGVHRQTAFLYMVLLNNDDTSERKTNVIQDDDDDDDIELKRRQLKLISKINK